MSGVCTEYISPCTDKVHALLGHLSAYALNASAANALSPLAPIRLDTAPALPIPHFPTTKGDLLGMTLERATALLEYYQLPVGNTREECINQLAGHIGMQGQLPLL